MAKNLTISIKDWRNLQAIHAGIFTLKHRYLPEAETEQIKRCLSGNFKELDKNNIPFRLQNLIIMLAEKRHSIHDIKDYYNLSIKYDNKIKQVI